jgi:hypothetical protein
MSYVKWEDSQKGAHGSIRGGITGQYGDMPPELHLKKQEQTCMYEDENQLDDHFRSVLRNRVSDAPSLAQDMPRETQDMVRSEVLNLRHSGARTSAEPIHPDLFLGFTDRDERGYHNSGPDYRKVVGQSQARGKFKDFVSDHASDWTIPESHRSVSRVISDIRKTINPMKERMKIFDTAFDGRSTAGSHPRGHHKSTRENQTIDGVILDLNNATEVGQRKGNTQLLSDSIKVGYKQTGDHKFSVAQYGLMSKKAHSKNIHDSQYQGRVSHKFDVSPSEVKNRLFINIIKEVGRRDYIADDRASLIDYFSKSGIAQNKIKKLTRDLSIIQNATDQSADVGELAYMGHNIKKVKVYDPVAHDSVIVDRDIFEKVKEHKNITFVKRSDNSLRRRIITKDGKAVVAGDEVQVHVYSRKRPEFSGQLTTKFGHTWKDTAHAPMYKTSNVFNQGLDANLTEAGQGVNPNADKVFNRVSKAAGIHQDIRMGIDEDAFNNDPVNDTSNFQPSHRRMAGRSSI